MCIPYGALLLAGGLVGKLVLGWGQPAVVMLVLGTAQVLLSNLSLAAWRGGKKSTAITLSEAGELHTSLPLSSFLQHNGRYPSG